MKKISLIAMFALVCNFAMAQIQRTSYRGAFAPAPTAMWTDTWTNFDPNNAAYGAVTTAVTADITANVTWTKDKVYELTRLITVRNNATLTIQAGTVIRSNAAASALVITRGAKLIANGTLAEPIVFTSKNSAGARNRGDWGGIVMLGKARYNINNGVNYIEGISQNINTEFGGGLTPDDNDNSGSLKYVRIEFAGYVFAPNNELNGLTLGAVGKGTTIDYVQVSYSNDDSFEWFGGSVDCKHLIAFNGLDDDWDVDNGFKGIIQFGLSIKDPLAADISTSEAFEVDNNAAGSDTNPAAAPTGQGYGDFTSAIFTNITCIGPNARPNGSGGFVTANSLHDKALRLRRAAQPKIFNSIFLDFKKGLVIESLSSNAAAVADKLKFKNNILVGPTAATFASVNTTSSSTPTTDAVNAWFAASGNTAFATNTTLLTKPYDLTSATTYTNLDYRPVALSAATENADFTDASLSGFIVEGTAPRVSNKSYCKGVVAPALNAELTSNGVSLRWFTTAALPLATVNTNVAPYTVAPVPSTSTVGSKKYYVREVDANGLLSAAAEITVTVTASPLVALGTITSTLTVGGSVATAAVGPYVGTTTELTYTVPASAEAGVASYLWSVPLGANIISGQGTNTIVVNYNNVASGLLKIGNIGVQAVNGGGCGGAIKTLAITAVLPASPTAIKMTDALLPVPTSGIAPAVTSFAKYMGQTTPLTLTATPVAAARSYVWELPTGVNLLNMGTVVGSPTTAFYGTFPFTVPGSRPTAVGNQYYQVIVTTYTSGIRIATASRFVVGGKLPNGVLVAPIGGYMATSSSNTTATSVQDGSVGVFKANAVGEAFTQVNGVTVDPAFPITTSTSNVITVDFAGVTSSNTFNYMTTTAVPVSTNVLRIGVRSINGVGVSLTSNATAVNPTTTSQAKLLTLTAARPAAPSAIKMTNDAVSTTAAVTAIGKFVGTTTPFTLTATASPLASSYTWELPAGVNQISGGNSNIITVNFAGVTPGAKSLFIGVKAVNAIGSSSTVNVGVNAASTFKYLSLAAALPAAPTSVVGQILLVCGSGGSYDYTITPSVLASSYIITAPVGSLVTSASAPMNNTNVLETSDLMFTVVYNGLVAPTAAAKKTLTIAAKNGVGTSLVAKSLTLTTGACVSTSKMRSDVVSATEVYPNPVSSDFSIDITTAKAGVLEIGIYSLDGNAVVSPRLVKLQGNANTINENVSSLKKGIYIVRLVNPSNNEVITKKLIKK